MYAGISYSPYALLSLACAVALAALVVFAWKRRRDAPGARAFAALMLAGCWWKLAYAAELASVGFDAKLFWTKVGHLGSVFVPLAWLALALAYAGVGDARARRRALALLSVVPIVTLALVWADGTEGGVRGLMWTSASLVRSGSFVALEMSGGPWYWVQVTYSYGLVLVGTVVLVAAVARSARPYLPQGLALLAGALVSWVANALYLAGLEPVANLNPSVLVFPITGALFALGLFRFGLLELSPVARDAAFGASRDGLVVADSKGRVVDLNPAAEGILGGPAYRLLGGTVSTLIPARLTPLEAAHPADGAEHQEVSLDDPDRGAPRRYDLAQAPVEDRGGRRVGRLLSLRDVTERRRAEEALRKSEEQHRRQARELDLLHRVRTALTRELDPKAVCRAAVEAVSSAYGYALVSAYLLQGGSPGDSEERTLVLQHQVGYETVIERVPVIEGVMGRAVRSGKSVLLEDATADPDFLGAVEGVVSEVCVLLFDGAGVVGTLNVESRDGDRLTEDDLRLLEAVGEHTSMAVSRAWLYARARESEERFRALVENIPAVVYMDALDEDNAAVYRSPHVREVLGYEPEDFISRPGFWQNLLHPEDRERVLAENERANRTGEPFKIEYRMIRKDGEAVWIRNEAVLIRDREGRPKFWQGYFVDITERRAAEARLREAEERYRTLVEEVPAVTYVGLQRRGEGSKNAYVSPQIEHILGYSPEEYLADPAFWLAAIHPSDRARVVAADLRTGETGEPFREEFRMVRKDGRMVWLREEGRLVRRGGDDLQVWHGVMFDITELKEAEEALRGSEERFRALVQNASDVISILNPDGTIRYVSPSVEQVLGYRPEERIGADAFGDGTHPHDAARLRKKLTEGLSRPGGISRPLEFRVRRKDGLWRHFEAVATNHLDHPAVGGIVVNARDVTERKAYEERLERQATHDPLTGLPNRRLLADRLGQALRRAEWRRGSVAVLFVDLDNFKYVNDSWGHDVGDRLLVSVAERLAAVLRPPDIVARLGGDEFVALLEDVGVEEEAIRVAERIAEALRAPFDLDGYEAFVTASVGVALGGPGAVGPEGAVDLLRRADLAMYEAKEGGKARHAVFDPAAERRTVRRLGLETGLRRALERDELVVHYQPVVSLSTGEIAGFEALVRWERPGRGLVAPSEFVPLAEETGLIVPIGRRVLEEACGRAKEWQDRYPKDPPLVVWANLSARQLKHPGLAGEVAAALEKTGLAPDTLTLEVTESALVGDTEAVLGALHEIRDLGARFALDDFGTGYSSLSYLKRLPVGLLKLDGSFVGGIGGTDLEEDEVLLSGVVGIAHGLGLRVCAEGVETPEQLSRVRALGCDLAQGFLFSRPLPAEAASELLAKNPRWR